jgi:hypothetical protein
MTRFSGRQGIVYLGQAGWSPQTGQPPAASPIAFITDWAINRTTSPIDVTAMGDGNKVYVSGLPDSSGSFNGWYDSASPQTYAASTDGLPRSFYLYEDAVGAATSYWFGVILPDMAIAGAVAAGVSLKSNWSAAGPIQRSRAGVIG